MNFRIIGIVISVIIIVSMIVVTVKTNFENKSRTNVVEEYPSGLIEDLPSDLKDENIDSESGVEKDEIAPDFELITLTGETVKLSDYRGKKVMLNFWVSWCSPCRIEMPYMEDYYEEYKETENVEVFAVNMSHMERDRSKTVKNFVDEHQLTFPILLDEEGEVTDLYEVRAYPTTYIINTEGIITDKINHAINEEKIKELVKNSN